MFWLHLGMPKTGTTALQGFVRSNPEMLAEAGMRYMETGRRRPEGGRLLVSHNLMAFHLNQTELPLDLFTEAMNAEYAGHSEQACLVSSEMFYSADLPRLAQMFAGLPPEDMRITFYCRRYSDFFEADYKQRAKSGRIGLPATEYVKRHLEQVRETPERFSFTSAVARMRQAFPGVAIVPMLYDRAEMISGNVVDDFIARIGVKLPEGATAGLPANPSLSRAASEAFGIVSRSMGRKRSRQLRRQVVTDPVMMRRHDVLEPDERMWLDTFMADQDRSFLQEFFPERSVLFTPVQLDDDDMTFRRDTPREYAALQRASEIVFRMALPR